MGRNGKEEGTYTQPTIAGLEAPQPEETELDNCLVLWRSEYRDTSKKPEWVCAIHAQPSLFHPETNAVFLASASHELATSARRKSRKPGDRVVLMGVVTSQTIAFSNGDAQTVSRIALTKAPHLPTKEKRIRTTIFEQNQRR